MAKRGMNERIQRLREQSVTTPVHIDLERAKIETDLQGKRRKVFCSGNESDDSEGILFQEDPVLRR